MGNFLTHHASPFSPREEVVRTVSIQRERFNSELGSSIKEKARKAKKCRDLVILSLYVYIPPSRCLEIRTLQIVHDPASMDARQQRECNLLMLHEDRAVFRFQDYKTKKIKGRDKLILEVCRLLTIYITIFRIKTPLSFQDSLSGTKRLQLNSLLPLIPMIFRLGLSSLKTHTS